MFKPTVSYRPLVAALAASMGLALVSGCQRDQPVPERVPAPTPSEPTPAPELVSRTVVMDRAGLIAAFDAAASAYSSGAAAAEPTLAGRRFSIRQAFGCSEPTQPGLNPADRTGSAAAAWGEDRRSLKLRLEPGDWTASPLIADAGEIWEAAEGIWLTRPWMRTTGCPMGLVDPPESGQPPPSPSPQTFGLAAVFTKEGSRLGRRNGRAYEYVVRGEDGAQPLTAPSQGYRLVLEGRMAAFPDGRAIRCHAASREQRPVCIAAVELDRVAFEDASGVMLSEWRAG